MTSFISIHDNSILNNSHSHSLPSSSLSTSRHQPLVMGDRQQASPLKCNGFISEVRSTSNASQHFQSTEPRVSSDCLLPPIQYLMVDTSPAPNNNDSSYASSNSSTISSNDEEEGQQYTRRKGSIASLLNSDPELKMLDKEPFCFFDNHPPITTKRGRPKRDEIVDETRQSKKQRQQKMTDTNKIRHRPAVMDKSGLKNEHSNSKCMRATKGLRHFSKLVCDKVAEKGITTYNEVADELAYEIQNSVEEEKFNYDQKNIRRRVYDALNVLTATSIITKDKKVIKWLGMPEYEDELLILSSQIEKEQNRQVQLTESIQQLEDLVRSNVHKRESILNLISRNRSVKNDSTSQRISQPYFMISSNGKIKQKIENDSRSAIIPFDSIAHQDTDILV